MCLLSTRSRPYLFSSDCHKIYGSAILANNCLISGLMCPLRIAAACPRSAISLDSSFLLALSDSLAALIISAVGGGGGGIPSAACVAVWAATSAAAWVNVGGVVITYPILFFRSSSCASCAYVQ